MTDIRLKRVYDPPSKSDGRRILVERLWPRGVTKEKAALDVWHKDIAPSPELRKWYGHDPEKWSEFKNKYRRELKSHTKEIKELRETLAQGRVTFVFAARDPERNSAVVWKSFLEKLA